MEYSLLRIENTVAATDRGQVILRKLFKGEPITKSVSAKVKGTGYVSTVVFYDILT